MIKGRARLDKRTKNLVKRLKPTDVAIIDHPDLDQVSAASLLETKVDAVINVSPFSTGRYPNMGPLLLKTAGVYLIEQVGPGIFECLAEGDLIKIDQEKIFKNGKVVAKGKALNLAMIEEQIETARSSISQELEKFAVNTLDYLKKEREIAFKAPDVPPVSTKFSGRHALVVVRGYDYKADLKTLRSYIKEMKPVLVGVDGGADALLEAGHRPHVIIGDMDSVSDKALRSGAEIVVHAYANGDAPGKERIDELGLKCHIFKAACTSEDLAMLLAYEKSTELIVAVGTHGHLVEFLDKGREGMASTFLVRLKVGDRLVDAKGVNQLYHASPRFSYLLILILAALTTFTVVIIKTPIVRLYLRTLLVKLRLIIGF